jgi:hypothetical protein
MILIGHLAGFYRRRRAPGGGHDGKKTVRRKNVPKRPQA